jgi:hypothetical protein
MVVQLFVVVKEMMVLLFEGNFQMDQTQLLIHLVILIHLKISFKQQHHHFFYHHKQLHHHLYSKRLKHHHNLQLTDLGLVGWVW